MPDPIDPPLITLADAAFRQAAVKVVRQARQSGTPLILWEGNAVRSIPPEERPERADPNSHPSAPHPA